MNNKGIGCAIAGSTMGTTDRARSKNDFYPTPPEVTMALLNSQFAPDRSRKLWEPSCGTYAMSTVQESDGYEVIATDLTYGDDFLAFTEPLAQQIMTNPPFNIADKFIRKAYELQVDYLALLLKATYWNAAKRYTLFQECKPYAVLPLTFRMDCTGQGSPTMDCSWYVWRPTYYNTNMHIFNTCFQPIGKGATE